jgi:hypothetical protein
MIIALVAFALLVLTVVSLIYQQSALEDRIEKLESAQQATSKLIADAAEALTPAELPEAEIIPDAIADRLRIYRHPDDEGA